MTSLFRRTLLAAVVAAFAIAPAGAGAQAVSLPAEMEGVEHVRQIPVNGTVGANFKEYGDKTYMFVTGTAGSPKTDPGLATQANYGGLWVYDVTTADNPTLVSHTPYPHYENEDVSIGGDRLLISGDGTLGGSNLVVFDISDPKLPRMEKVVNMQLLDEGHTATCIQECKYAWVAGGDTIAVLRLDSAGQVNAAPGVAPDAQVSNGPGVNGPAPVGSVTVPMPSTSNVEAGDLPLQREFGWGTHDVQVDEAGYAWVVGGNGTIGFDVRESSYGEGNLLSPAVVARTGPDALGSDGADGSTVNDFIHHNSWRPDADAFASRAEGDLDDTTVRPGEKVLITEEDIWDRWGAGVTKGGCKYQGSFQTWQVKQLGATSEDQSTVKFLDEWKTEYNQLAEAAPEELKDMPPLNGGFCSAHYFDEQDGIVAGAWYEQGTRILDTRDPRDIKQVGYFMAPDSVVWAAYWAPTDKDVIYVADHQRGIDVLRVTDGGSVAKAKRVKAPLASWWKKGKRAKKAGYRADSRFGWACRLAL